MQWRLESAHCGTCGALNHDAPDQLARLCPVCGRLEFPRISPAIIVLITNEKDEALLAHNARFTAGRYGLIAGFNEAGESLEATLKREAWEEVKIRVKNVRYITSQPWPFPNSLMVGFRAEYESGTITPDGTEIADAQWFARDALPSWPGSGSVAHYLLQGWIDRRF
jgi:NAD+ diphosphatase